MGGQLPSDRLRAIGGNTAYLVRLDPELAEAVAAVDPSSQRSMAVWAARRVCEAAPPTDIDWPAVLAAVERGDPPPAPFDNPSEAWTEAFPGPKAVVVHHAVEPSPPRLHPKASVLGAVLAACHAEPARAAIEAVIAARPSAPGAGGISGRGPATARDAAALETIRRTKPER